MKLKNCNFKVIGVNKTTEHLNGVVFNMPNFVFSEKNNIATTKINSKDYSFDIKNIYFVDGEVIIDGFVADESSKVGRISLKYLP